MGTFNLPVLPWRYPYHSFRAALVQPAFWAFFFLAPLFRWFQLDVVNQHLVFVGQSYPLDVNHMKWVPIAFFGGVLLIAVISTIWGRLFCGWACPHNTLTEWTQPLRMLIGLGKKPFYLLAWERGQAWVKPAEIVFSLLWALALTYLISLLFMLYFFPLDWYLDNLRAGTLNAAVWGGHVLMMLIGLFMVYAGHEFCRSACPYGLSQSLSAYLSAKWIPMEIRFRPGKDTSLCKSCHACQSACPVDIDPREPENLVVGIGEGCFNCGKCIDACTHVRAFQHQPGLLQFQMNPPLTPRCREIAE